MEGSSKARARTAAQTAARQAPREPFGTVAHPPKSCQETLETFGIRVGPAERFAGTQVPGWRPHPVLPTACFLSDGIPVAGAETYSEEQTIVYLVSQDSEARFLRDAEAAFARRLAEAGTQATLREWLDHLEGVTAEMFAARPIRIPSGEQGPPFSREDAAQIARCIRQQYEAQMRALGIPLTIPLQNGPASSGRSRAE